MDLIANKAISAFCILCPDAEAVLPFYMQLLGFRLQRSEESFYSFVRRGTATTLCLWEIGHLAEHTDYATYSTAVIPSKVMLSLTLAEKAELDKLYRELKAADLLLTEPAGNHPYGFYFIDPCAVIWELRLANNPAQAMALDRITLLCQDVAAAKSFYETKLALPETPLAAGRVTYPAVDNTSLSLLDVQHASTILAKLDFAAQLELWSATTSMLALAYESTAQLQTAYRSLSENGVLFDHEPTYFAWEFNASYFRDPENNIWELFEMPSNIAQRQLRN